MQPITYNAGRPTSVTLRLPMDRTQRHQARPRPLRPGPLVDGPHHLEPRPALRPVHRRERARARSCRTASRSGSPTASVRRVRRRQGRSGGLCSGEVQNWKDISPRVGFAMDVFGNGRTAVKASVARYVAGQQVAVARSGQPGRGADAAPTHALDRSRRQRLALRRQRQHSAERADALDVDADVRPSTSRPPRMIRRC